MDGIIPGILDPNEEQGLPTPPYVPPIDIGGLGPITPVFSSYLNQAEEDLILFMQVLNAFIDSLEAILTPQNAQEGSSTNAPLPPFIKDLKEILQEVTKFKATLPNEKMGQIPAFSQFSKKLDELEEEIIDILFDTEKMQQEENPSFAKDLPQALAKLRYDFFDLKTQVGTLLHLNPFQSKDQALENSPKTLNAINPEETSVPLNASENEKEAQEASLKGRPPSLQSIDTQNRPMTEQPLSPLKASNTFMSPQALFEKDTEGAFLKQALFELPDSMHTPHPYIDAQAIPFSNLPEKLTEDLIISLSSKSELTQVLQILQDPKTFIPITMLVPYPIQLTLEAGISRNKEIKSHKSENKKDKEKEGREQKKQPMVFLPKGPALVGDAFKEGRLDEIPLETVQLGPYLIGAVPVTVGQYVSWLNEAYEKKEILFKEQGKIFDLQGRLLARTSEGAGESMIESCSSNGELFFKPLKGRDFYPATHISFYGAQAFCRANGFKLPNEAQWEKAAGMEIPREGEALKKYRFGCGQDTIDLSLANYRTTYTDEKSYERFLTPIAFYNGQTTLTKSQKSLQTKNAKSPYGCYDMSGTVREWIDKEDHSGQLRMTKGGGYLDPSYEVRVSAKVPLDPYATLSSLGFRVILELP